MAAMELEPEQGISGVAAAAAERAKRKREEHLAAEAKRKKFTGEDGDEDAGQDVVKEGEKDAAEEEEKEPSGPEPTLEYFQQKKADLEAAAERRPGNLRRELDILRELGLLDQSLIRLKDLRDSGIGKSVIRLANGPLQELAKFVVAQWRTLLEPLPQASEAHGEMEDTRRRKGPDGKWYTYGEWHRADIDAEWERAEVEVVGDDIEVDLQGKELTPVDVSEQDAEAYKSGALSSAGLPSNAATLREESAAEQQPSVPVTPNPELVAADSAPKAAAAAAAADKPDEGASTVDAGASAAGATSAAAVGNTDPESEADEFPPPPAAPTAAVAVAEAAEQTKPPLLTTPLTPAASLGFGLTQESVDFGAYQSQLALPTTSFDTDPRSPVPPAVGEAGAAAAASDPTALPTVGGIPVAYWSPHKPSENPDAVAGHYMRTKLYKALRDAESSSGEAGAATKPFAVGDLVHFRKKDREWRSGTVAAVEDGKPKISWRNEEPAFWDDVEHTEQAAEVANRIMTVIEGLQPKDAKDYLKDVRNKFNDIEKALLHPGNTKLRARLFSGQLEAATLVGMNKRQLLDPDEKQLRNEMMGDAMHSIELRPDPQVTSESFQCPSCGARKVTFVQAQIHSGDEPMTVWCTCTACGHKWTHGEE